MDPEWFVSDPTLDPTFKEVSDPATLVSALIELREKLALYS
jgi:hypothetical protein